MDEAEKIILCGMTPFARGAALELRKRGYKVSFMDKYGMGAVVAEKEKFQSENLYVHCSRPFLDEYMKMLDDDDQQIMYQQLLLLDAAFDASPYAYTQEKVIKQMNHIVQHQAMYFKLLDCLADRSSKELLEKILLFRLTFDCSLNKAVKSNYPHYFEEDLFALGNKEIFVDGGGYNGDTLNDFLQITQNTFEEYHLFEPEQELIEQAKRLSNDSRISYHCLGLFDKRQELRFSKGENGNGNISGAGADKIKVVSLDEYLAKEITFIKLDVEGAEMEALKGAEKTIKRDHPKLAICIYHKYDDILNVFNYLDKFDIYRFFVRAQMDNLDTELTLYAIPKI